MQQRSLAVELRALSNQIIRRVDKKHPLCSGPNVWIIAFLALHEQDDVFLRDLEREFGVTRSTACKVVNLMERKGLIRREGVARDARLKKLCLTPAAQALCQELAAYEPQLERELTQGFAPAELETLYGYLERMRQNMTEAADNETATGKDMK